MYCKNCGKELENGSTLCKYCGWKVENNNEEKIESINLDQGILSQNTQTNENNIQNFNNVQNVSSNQNGNSNNVYAQNSVNQSNVNDSTQQNSLNQNMQTNTNNMQNVNNVQNTNNNQNIINDAYASNSIGVSSVNNSAEQSNLNNNQYNNVNDNWQNNINNMGSINNTQNTVGANNIQSDNTNMQESNFNGNINNNLNQNQNNGKKQGFLSKIVNNKPLFISLIVIFALIIIGLLIFIIVTVSNNSKKTEPVVNNDITTTQKQEITTTTQSGNKNVSTSNVVTLGGYEFTIPNDLYHEIQDEQLAVTDSNTSFAVSINVNTGSYDYFKANLSLLEDELSQTGYTVISSSEKSYSGLNYLTIQLQYSGMDAYLAIYKLSDTEVAISAVILNNSTPDNAFGRLSEILKTANKVDSSSTSEFNISEFSKEIGELEK